MFGRPFMPGLQAAQAGLIPGQIQEDVFGALQDPRAIAALMGTPMTPGGGIGGDLPQVRGMQDDPRGLMSQRGGIGGPAMPMGDMGPPRPKGDAPGMFAAAGPLNGSGSIRNALANNAMETPAKPFKGMFPGKDWKYAVGTILPAAINGYLAASGNPLGQANIQHMNRMKEAKQEAEMRMRLPQQVGNSMVQMNAQGGYDTLYTAPGAAQLYAKTFGPEGSPEYQAALEDYVLKSYGGTAMGNRLTLEDHKTDNRLVVQDDQQSWRDGNREDWQKHGYYMQNDRQSHSDGQLGRRLDVQRRGQDKSAETQRGSYSYQHGGGKGGAKPLGSGGSTEFAKAAPTDKLVGQPVERDGIRIQYSATRKAYVRVK